MKNEKQIKALIQNALQIITLLFSIVLIIDMSFSDYEVETLIDTHGYRQNGGLRNGASAVIYGFETDVNDYVVSRNIYEQLDNVKTLTIHKSKILKEVLDVEIDYEVYHNSDYSIYNANSLFPILCILSSLLALIFRFTKSKHLFISLALASILTFYLLQSVVLNNFI